MIKVIIGGTEIQTTPIGWQDLTTTIRLDRELKGLFTVMDVSLTFIEDGYNLLRNNFDSHGYSYSQSASILQMDDDGNYYPVFTGTLFYKDIEFSEGIEGASAKAQLTDNSFFAKIQNNKNLKAKIYVGLSKNAVAIDPADYNIIRFFEPSTGNYYSLLGGYDRQDTGFKAYDVLRFFVDYMSDGEVDFISDTFGPGGEYEGTMITCGYIPRFTSGALGTGVTQELFEANFPDLSFYDVFTELNKLFNLGFVSGFDGSRPFIRIEKYSYLFPKNIIQDLSNVDKLRRKAASEYLYSKLTIGSEQIDNEPTLVSFPELIRFVGFNSEEYAILADGEDRELNLVNQWIISSNIIEDLLVNATTVPTTWDQDIVVVACTLDSGTWKANKTNWIATPAPYYYNEIYNNENKALRWFDGLPSSIAAYLNDSSNKFRVTLTTDYFVDLPIGGTIIPYDDDSTPPNFDNGGNFDTSFGANFFLVPQTGIYTFLENINIDVHLPCQHVIGISVMDSTLTTEISGKILSSSTLPFGLNSLSLMGTVYAEAGNKIVFSIFSSLSAPSEVKAGSWVESIVAGSTGNFLEKDPKDFPIIRGQFDYPVSLQEFRNIQTNPLGLFSYGVNNGKTYFGWIEELKYKHFKAASSFTLISNEKTL